MLNLPTPDADASAHSERLREHIVYAINAAGGWLSFARFMEQVLYAPGLGYYSAGARKFGAAGDFVTAPELTGLFGQALARQVAQIMANSAPVILEVGAGSGRLAADLLLALEAAACLPEHYLILDLSADLRQRQHDTIAQAAPHLLSRVNWLDALPEHFCGVVVANELLDAMPVHVVRWEASEIYEKGVVLDDAGRFTWNDRPATGALLAAAKGLQERHQLPPGYESEIGLAAAAWAASWGERLEKGALLLIDYGFPQREFYHPQRARGTLMCHYRHHSHTDPFFLPGLQDVTVHVDFTSIIAAAHGQGLDLLGYANQGQFLLNCGILDQLAKLDSTSRNYPRASSAVNTLLMPHEMGELFKVMAIGRGVDAALIGFMRGDQRHRL